jgi:hypothetical protein
MPGRITTLVNLAFKVQKSAYMINKSFLLVRFKYRVQKTHKFLSDTEIYQVAHIKSKKSVEKRVVHFCDCLQKSSANIYFFQRIWHMRKIVCFSDSTKI